MLDSSAPLYGRARALLELKPLLPGYLQTALNLSKATRAVQAYAIMGGIPRYWELALEYGDDIDNVVNSCILDPLSPLYREPERLLLEETPPAISLRPLLDLIGGGANRVSELAGRLGVPATSLSRPLSRLVELGLVKREIPYGEPEHSSKRSLYKISDPFFRLWFRIVAPNKALLAEAPAVSRKALWERHKTALFAQSWEEMSRQSIPFLHRTDSPVGRFGPWEPAKRYWHGNEPEWDVVSRSLDDKKLLLGEVKWSASKVTTKPKIPPFYS